MRPLFTIVALGVLLAVPLVQAEGSEVSIQDYTFSPTQLTVTAGTQVTWTNRDQVPHLVVDQDKQFRSPALDTNEHYTFTFSHPGTYHYFCSLHPQMTGTITVVQEK